MKICIYKGLIKYFNIMSVYNISDLKENKDIIINIYKKTDYISKI